MAKVFTRDSSSALKIYEPSGSSISGKSQRDPSSALEIYEPSGFTELTTSNVKRLLYKMKNIFLRWPYFDWMQMILVVTVISVDPFTVLEKGNFNQFSKSSTAMELLKFASTTDKSFVF